MWITTRNPNNRFSAHSILFIFEEKDEKHTGIYPWSNGRGTLLQSHPIQIRHSCGGKNIASWLLPQALI